MKQATEMGWIFSLARILQGAPICLAILILAASLAPAAIAANQAEFTPNPDGVTEVEIDVWGISFCDTEFLNLSVCFCFLRFPSGLTTMPSIRSF
jgi:hypothetical protein